jgi:hypothetical protein
MKMLMSMGLLCGLLAGQPVAEAPKIERPHWVIVATVIDLSTGAALRQSVIEGAGMKFDDPGECESILHKVPTVLTDRVAVILTCARVGPDEVAV